METHCPTEDVVQPAPPRRPVTNTQAHLDTRSEVIACKLKFVSEGCKVIVKN